MQIPGIELESSGLVSSPLTHWAILPALGAHRPSRCRRAAASDLRVLCWASFHTYWLLADPSEVSKPFGIFKGYFIFSLSSLRVLYKGWIQVLIMSHVLLLFPMPYHPGSSAKSIFYLAGCWACISTNIFYLSLGIQLRGLYWFGSVFCICSF